MKHLPLIGVATVSALATVAAVAFTGGAQTAGRTIVLTEAGSGAQVRFVDNPPASRERRGTPRATLGDGLAISTRLLDASGARAGRLEATCVDVKPGLVQFDATFLCTAVAHLADGDLFLQTRFRPRTGPTDARGAITGGTGAYAGARGTFMMVGRPSTDTFTLLP